MTSTAAEGRARRRSGPKIASPAPLGRGRALRILTVNGVSIRLCGVGAPFRRAKKQGNFSRSNWRSRRARSTVRGGGGWVVHLYYYMTEDSAILLVEDNEDDVFLMRHALAAAGVVNPVFVAETGAQAVDYLSGAGEYGDRKKFPLPTVVFLDLKLPLMSGHEVLAWIRTQPPLEGLLVVVLTSSNEPSDVRRSYSLGASSYLVKPMSARQLLDLAKALNWTWLRRTPAAAAAPGK